jgi:hypothetical protein
MKDQEKQNNYSRTSFQEEKPGKGHGPQGIDKAPGEETSQDNDNFVQQTQRGKNKVDGDPTKKSDQPIDNK